MVSKWHNVITYVDGLKFHSKKEAARYIILKDANFAGTIQNLALQVPYKFFVNTVWICTYYADFVYTENGVEVVEDTKGKRIPPYGFKKKLMKALYGILIKET
jgi:hypothetical protein